MGRKHAPLLLTCVSAALLALAAGCSSIERSSQIENHQLAAKVSSKNDIVNAIGLPRAIERDAEKGLEIWLYTGKPVNTSYFVPLPFAAVPAGGGMSTVYYVDAGSKKVGPEEKIVLALVFNADGLLAEIQKK